MRNNEYLIRKENFLIGAELKNETENFTNVPCKIYLPERTHDKPKIVIKPSQNDSAALSRLWRVSLDAKGIGFTGDIEVIVRSRELYIKHAETKLWGKEISECTIYCEPENLEVIRFTGSAEQTATIVTFWISPNSYITPSAIFERSYSGEIRKEDVRVVEHEIGSFKYNFAKHFRYKTEENNDLTQWHVLVAECETTSAAIDTEKIKNAHLQELDDFLLLISFASRHKTVCMGWEACDNVNHVDFYRGNYCFPEPGNERMHQGLIDISDIEDFIAIAGKSFYEYKNRLSIRASLNAALTSKNTTLEKGFLSSFAGLESLILDFRRYKNLEFVLHENEWIKLRSAIKETIKTSTMPALSPQQRNSIYSKLNEINRISLREAFDQFCAHYSIPHQDLWPLFGSKERAGLSDIRNNLIHGNPFPHHLMEPLVVAKIHIEILHERSLLRILNWGISNSDVNKRSVEMHRHLDHSKNIKTFLLDGA